MTRLLTPRAAAVTLICLPYVGLATWLARIQDLRSVGSFFATVGLLQLLLAFAARDWRRFLILQLPLVVLSWAFCAYTLTFDTPPGRALGYVFQSSSWAEWRGFFSIWAGLRLALAATVIAVTYLTLACLTPRMPIAAGSNSTRWVFIGAIVLSGAYAATSEASLFDGIALNPAVGTVLFVTGPLSEARSVLSGESARRSKIPYRASPVNGEEVHILVIGESARRDSWSIYGYERKTTPLLEKLRGEAIFFQQAVADANLTVYAVPILLTGMHAESFHASAVTGNLERFARESGYHTAWLMNQDPGPSLLVGMQADEMFRPSTLANIAQGRSSFDESLLPPLTKALAHRGMPLFIGLHTLGSHWEYADRYPPAFGRFGPSNGLSFSSLFTQRSDQRMINAYDASIAYTDWFLDRVISEVRKLDVPATVTYVSDHGEDLYILDGNTGHGTAGFSKHQYEIPAFVWANSAYRVAHPQQIQALIANSNRRIRSHNVFYTLADLMGIRWPGAKPAESFASPEFQPDLTSLFISGGSLVPGPH